MTSYSMGGYSGPIDLVVYYDSTSGMIQTSYNNGQQGPRKFRVELSFDFADTTSKDGSITKILQPDDGSDPVEGDPSDRSNSCSYTWMTHGFNVELTQRMKPEIHVQ